MTVFSRRNIIKTMATISLVGTDMSFAEEKTNTEALSSLQEIKPKPLSFNAKKLLGISEKLILSHWENNYGGAVKSLNAVNKKLKELASDKDLSPAVYNGLKREHLVRTNSVVLHELYFSNLGGDGKIGNAIESNLKLNFGGYSQWESEYKKIALGLAGGSGWVVLGYNYHLRRLENYWLADHLHSPAGTVPLLVMDMYEHSYHLDYGAAAAKYIESFFKNINWEIVSKRFEFSQKWTWI
jgi:superoxide dismutase, Fe-Mn family